MSLNESLSWACKKGSSLSFQLIYNLIIFTFYFNIKWKIINERYFYKN